MSIQDRDSLAMDALSILGDKPPQPPVKQPSLDDGIHLRWSPGKNKGYPVKGGYYLFRRRTDGPVCLMPKLKTKSPAELQTMAQVITDIGTLATTIPQPFGVLQNDGVVEGILFADPKTLRFNLPKDVTTRSVSVRVRFLGEEPVTTHTWFKLGIDPDRAPAPVVKSGVSYQPFSPNGQPDQFATIVPGVEDTAFAAMMCVSRIDVTLPAPSLFCRVVVGKGGAKVDVYEEDGKLAKSVQYGPQEWGVKEFNGQQLRKIVITGKGIRLYSVDYLLPPPLISVGVSGFRQNNIVTKQLVSGTRNQEANAVLESKADLDAIQIISGPAALLDLCYTPVASPTGGTGVENPPGRRWEAVPNFKYPLTLPIIHPAYPASTGPESIAASLAIAKPRLRYGTWADEFKSNSRQAANGLANVISGSPIVTGTNTQWTSALEGSLICFPGSGADFVGYIIMAVLAPDRLVLSRTFSGPSKTGATYQLITKTESPDPMTGALVAIGDDFAELHDQLACLLQSPNGMRAATAPPLLDQGKLSEGKFISSVGSIDKIQGFGTTWTKDYEGTYIEIGPKWFSNGFSTRYVDERSVFRIASVDTTNQIITLDSRFPGFSTCKADFRILVRSTQGQADSPNFELKPMEAIELASLRPSYAQVVGLYWIDTAAEKNATYDYIVLADFDDRFTKQSSTALAWLNGSPDFTGPSVDGCLIKGIKHAGSLALPPPSNMRLFDLPGGGGRLSFLRPYVADSDVGISITEASNWPSRPTAQRPLMANAWRLFRGTDANNLKPDDPAKYWDLGMLVPQSYSSGKLPQGWPSDPLHFIDSRLDVGWYSYRFSIIDLFGRCSELSVPLAWTNKPLNEAPVSGAVHLADRTAPPPPVGVQAWALDDRDPYCLRDDRFAKWRAQFPAAAEWKKWKPGDSYPKQGAPVVGLRLQWRWPWTHLNQGADLKDFRIYFQSKPLNARLGTVLSVAPVNGHPDQSEVTLDLEQKDPASDAYKSASLQVGNRSYPILGSQTGTNVTLIVRNGGPSQKEAPASSGPATIVIPVPTNQTDPVHPLYKDLLDPLNWDLWLASVPDNDPGVRHEVELLEDTSVKTFDDDQNPFMGAAAKWNGSVITLDAIPTGLNLSSVRPGIDVISLASVEPPDYFVFDIKSVDSNGKKLTPASTTGLSINATYQWRIGPRIAGFEGLAAQWKAVARQLVLDGAGDVSAIRPGVDMAYLPADGNAAPSNLNYFFPIISVDTNTRTLTLTEIPNKIGKLSLLNGKTTVPWKIGRPQRIYEVFLPETPAALPKEPYKKWLGDPTDATKPALWKAELKKPVAYGTVSVSSADIRTEIPDKRLNRVPSLTGNESALSGPGTVYLVHRDPPPPPVAYKWGAGHLVATRANYRGESFFTMRWMKPVDPNTPQDSKYAEYFSAHIYRAMDSSLALAHWNNRLSEAAKKAVAPEKASADLVSLLKDIQTAPEETGPYPFVTRYEKLNDAELMWLAGQEVVFDGYTQMTINALPLAAPSTQDRLGPNDDPATFKGPDQNVCAYVDTLDGKSQNRYFYRVMLVNSAQSRGELGDPTPPVYLPKVMPPRTPSITKILSGELAITLKWALNREPDLAAYRVYRTEDADKARDVRLMDVAATMAQADVNLSHPGVEWTDNAELVGGQQYYYRVTAMDTAGNESNPTAILSCVPVDTRVPPPPVWTEQTWLFYRQSDNTFIAWPKDGTAPPEYTPVLRLGWFSETPEPQFVVTRLRSGEQVWTELANTIPRPSTTAKNEYVLLDFGADPSSQTAYRLKVRSSTGVWSNEDSILSVPSKGGE